MNIDRPDYDVNLESVNILTVEIKNFERSVMEAIYIQVTQPSLNRDGDH